MFMLVNIFAIIECHSPFCPVSRCVSQIFDEQCRDLICATERDIRAGYDTNLVRGECGYGLRDYRQHQLSWPYFEQKQTHFKVSPNRDGITKLRHLNVATHGVFHHQSNKQPEQIGWNDPLKRLTFVPLAL